MRDVDLPPLRHPGREELFWHQHLSREDVGLHFHLCRPVSWPEPFGRHITSRALELRPDRLMVSNQEVAQLMSYRKPLPLLWAITVDDHGPNVLLFGSDESSFEVCQRLLLDLEDVASHRDIPDRHLTRSQTGLINQRSGQTLRIVTDVGQIHSANLHLSAEPSCGAATGAYRPSASSRHQLGHSRSQA